MATDVVAAGAELDAHWYQTFFDEHWLTISSQTHSPEKSAAEVAFLVEELGLQSGQIVLDLPCGHGRHSIEFARRGLRVVGVDLNEEPLEQAYWAAREAGVKVDLRRVDMREIEFREEFDAVFNLWTSFGYFENEAEDRLVLDRAFRALRPGGAFVLETVNLYAVLRRFEPRSWQRSPSRPAARRPAAATRASRPGARSPAPSSRATTSTPRAARRSPA